MRVNAIRLGSFSSSGDGRDVCKVVAAVVYQLDWVSVVFNRAFGIWGGRIADVVGGIAVGWLGGRRSGMVSCSTDGWVLWHPFRPILVVEVVFNFY